MSMEERGPSLPADGDARGGRLDSWKEIAVYLERDVRTVQRWERREGLPVHRQQHDKLGSVYAFRHEIDAWRTARSQRLEEPASGAASTSDAVTSSEADIPSDASVPIDPATSRVDRRHRHRSAATAIAAAVVIAVAAWLVFRQNGRTFSGTRVEIRSIVVLPFENLSGDPSQEFFVAGLTEEVTARLAQLATLRVVSRTSAMSLQGRRVPVPAIARDMDVDGVVEGSVRREGGRVRISIQLIDARTDTHMWARDFERESAAAWPLQIEVAQAVADAIRVQATPEERARLAAVPSVSPEARDPCTSRERS